MSCCAYEVIRYRMNYYKCVFNYRVLCWGKTKKVDYEKPINYWNWPIAYLCENHKDETVTWKDALNTRSNVLISEIKMSHTNELSAYQSLDVLSIVPKIDFCLACNGTGEEGDCIESPKLCKECNCTGRKNENTDKENK